MTVLTDLGEAAIIDAILAQLTLYAGWGTGTQAEAKTVTALNAAASESRSSASEVDNGDDADYTATITATGARAITEVGFFDAAGTGNPPTGGNMLVYDTFSVINLATDDAIEFSMNLEIA